MASPASGAKKPGSVDMGVLAMEREAVSLVDRMPELLMDADRIAATVTHGIHGRRRAGTGETFWQFRQFQPSDGAQLIDWRRSASSDHLFVREREWEAAHTIHLFTNLTRSMAFRSHLSPVSKRDRALVLTLAATELLVRGGERVALLGAMAPTSSRNATMRIAETIVAREKGGSEPSSLPPSARLSRFSGLVVISDFLDPIEDIRASLDALAADGAAGHLVQVLDPAEETLPYEGRTEFLGPNGEDRWLTDRVENLRLRYRQRIEAHRAAVSDIARRLGWTFLVHHTDRPASEPMLALMMRLDGSHGGYRWHGPKPTSSDAKGRP